MDYALEVDVDDVIPLVERDIAHIGGDPDPGVVKEVVDPAVAGDHVLHERPKRRGIAHVEPEGFRAVAGCANGVGHGARGLAARVGDNHDSPLARQRLGDRFSDAGTTAGQDDDLVAKIVHGRCRRQTCITPEWKRALGIGRPTHSRHFPSTVRVSCGWMIASTQPRAAPYRMSVCS